MKLQFMALLCCLSMFFAGTALAFNPPVPTGYVTDTAGALSPAQVAQLNRSITDFNKRTQNEIGVLLIKSVGDESIEDVTHQTFKAWRVGKAGLDNGVLLVLAIESRKMRLQTGSGIEGEITDLQSNDILVSMRPGLRAKDYNGAVTSAVNKIETLLESRQGKKVDPGQGAQFNRQNVQNDNINPAPAPTARQNNNCDVGAVGAGSGVTWFAGLILLMVGMIVAARALIRRSVRKNMEAAERQAEAELAAEAKVAKEAAAYEAAWAAEQAAKDKAEALAQAEASRKAQALRELEAAKAIAAEVTKVEKPAPKKVAKPVAVIKSPAPRPAPKKLEVDVNLKAKKEASSQELRKKLNDKAAAKRKVTDEVPTRRAEHYAADAALAASEAAIAAEGMREFQAREAARRAEADAESRRVEARRAAEQEEEERRERQRREDERRAQARRDEDAAADRRRREESSRSSSSDSGWSGGGSSGGGYDSGGGFGGGDSGGGGGSSDW